MSYREEPEYYVKAMRTVRFLRLKMWIPDKTFTGEQVWNMIDSMNYYHEKQADIDAEKIRILIDRVKQLESQQP